MVSGRWSQEEHDLFVNAMERWPKQWSKIAALVKTRTVVQIRTHAQKCWKKQNGQAGPMGGMGSTELHMGSVSNSTTPPQHFADEFISSELYVSPLDTLTSASTSTDDGKRKVNRRQPNSPETAAS